MSSITPKNKMDKFQVHVIIALTLSTIFVGLPALGYALGIDKSTIVSASASILATTGTCLATFIVHDVMLTFVVFACAMTWLNGLP